MDKEQLLQLEKASIDVMSPPHAVTVEQRKQAEDLFMELRKSKLPYNACKFILENTQSDFVLFQAVSTLREAVIREWPILPTAEKVELQSYLLRYLTAGPSPSLEPYVRNQLLHTVALLVKRATLEADCEQQFTSVLDSVARMLSSGDVKMRHLGCSLLSALVTEYSSSSGSSSIGLPLEFHLQCKKVIQKEQLLSVLHFATQMLQQFLPLDFAALPKEDHALLSSFLGLVSQILNWDFQQQHKMFSTNPEIITIPLRPPQCYAHTFLDPPFLYLFFRLLAKVRTCETDFHHVVQCLTQLSSLTKPVFSSPKKEQQYLTNFVGGFLEYVSSSSELSQQEVYGLSCVLRRLSTNFSIEQFAGVGSEQLKTLIQLLTQLTCLCAQKAVLDEDEERALSYREALDHYLEVCVSFLTFWDPASPLLPPQSILVQPMVDIFNAYTQSKLSAPRGWRAMPLQDDEIIDIEEEDREVYADELSSIGCIARAIPGHSLPLLGTLLDQCVEECLRVLVLIQQNPSSSPQHQSELDSTYEDLHWLVLVAGYTLCDIAQGEEVQVPVELMRHSISCHEEAERRQQQQQPQQEPTTNRLDLEQNVAALFLDDGVWGGGAGLSALDPVVSLVLGVCRMGSLEKQFVTRGLFDLLSPQLCETIVWCLSRIVEPYIMFSDLNYQQVSFPLIQTFGKDSVSGKWLVGFLVEKVAFNLSVWVAEEKLSFTSIQLLHSVVKSQLRAGVCIQCDVTWTMMRSFSDGSSSISQLSPSVQKGLMGSLVKCAVGERKKEFLSQLLQPFQTRFTSIVQAPDFHTHCHQEATKLCLRAVLEAMCGLASCVRIVYVQEFFIFLLPMLQVGVSLLELYGGTTDVVVDVILELFVLVADNYTVFLDHTNTVQLYEVCLNLIQAYAKCNAGKYSKVCLTEEEQCEDLLLFLKLLSHLTTKDYLNFAPDDSNSAESQWKVEPVDVMVTGVSIVLPLMSEETLKFPNLCRQFFTLLHYMCRDFPEKVVTLPEKMVSSFMKLLEIGLTNFSQEICVDCLECVESLVTCYSSSPKQQDHTHTLFTQYFRHFLKVIFELALSSVFDMDLCTPASASIFTLICTQQDYYSSLAEALVSSQSCEPQNHVRLVQAFQQLTPPSLSLDLTKQSKQTFRKNFEQFLPFVKGFLFYR